MTSFTIEVQDGEVLAALNRLQAKVGNLDPALKAIGDALLLQTKKTFETSTDPWGRKWKPNSDTTLRAMLYGTKGSFSKKKGSKEGTLTKTGHAVLSGKKPLIGATRLLSGTSLHSNVAGGTLTLGSSAFYAAMQQFGGTRSQFPNLWGDIPARPFLPVTSAGQLSPNAQKTIISIIQEHLLGF